MGCSPCYQSSVQPDMSCKLHGSWFLPTVLCIVWFSLCFLNQTPPKALAILLTAQMWTLAGHETVGRSRKKLMANRCADHAQRPSHMRASPATPRDWALENGTLMQWGWERGPKPCRGGGLHTIPTPGTQGRWGVPLHTILPPPPVQESIFFCETPSGSGYRRVVE